MRRAWVVGLLAAGCYAPTFEECVVRCNEGCPSGLTCDSVDGFCHVPGVQLDCRTRPDASELAVADAGAGPDAGGGPGCWTTREVARGVDGFVSLALDPDDGTPHAVYEIDGEVMYGGLAGDAWEDEPVSHPGAGVRLGLAIDPLYGPHIVFDHPEELPITHVYRFNTTWVEQFLGDGVAPAIASGADRSVHVVVQNGDSIEYQALEGGGQWSEPVFVAAGRWPYVVADASGRVHVVMAAGDRDFEYSYSIGDGNWHTKGLALFSDQAVGRGRYGIAYHEGATTAASEVYASWTTDLEDLEYMHFPVPGQQFGGEVQVGGVTGSEVPIAVTPDDTAYVGYYRTGSGRSEFVIARQTLDGWDAEPLGDIPTAFAAGATAALQVDADGVVHALYFGVDGHTLLHATCE